MGFVKNVDKTTAAFLSLMTLGLIGLVFLILFGNLSGNLGFASGTQGYNDTEAVITNLTGGATTFFGFANVWFTLLAVVLLIIIIISVIAVVGSFRGGSKFSN